MGGGGHRSQRTEGEVAALRAGVGNGVGGLSGVAVALACVGLHMQGPVDACLWGRVLSNKR